MNLSGFAIFVGLAAVAASTMPWGGIILIGAMAFAWWWDVGRKR